MPAWVGMGAKGLLIVGYMLGVEEFSGGADGCEDPGHPSSALQHMTALPLQSLGTSIRAVMMPVCHSSHCLTGCVPYRSMETFKQSMILYFGCC